jgi:hypothetical protein
MADLEIARLEACLRRYARAFLMSRSTWLRPLTDALDRLLSPRPLYLFGGLLRDLLVTGPEAVPRDVDLVIGNTDGDELAAALAPFLDRRTRFGGLQLTVEGVAIDIWPLSDTWAFRQPDSPPASFDALPRTTFLNVEAVALEVLPGGEPGRLHSHGFFEGIRAETLEINFEDNPSPALCVARSLALASRLGFHLGPRLTRYLAAHLRVLPVEELVRLQAAESGCVRCSEETIRAWKAYFADPASQQLPSTAMPRAKCA